MLVFRKLALLTGALLLGAVGGPLVIATWGAFGAPPTETARGTAAYNLLDAFDDYYPHGIVMYSIDDSVLVRDCGYDQTKLFGQQRSLAEGKNWTPYTGYFDLSLWLSSEFLQEVKDRGAEYLGRHLNGFGLVFLERCISQTAFASSCAGKVRHLLEAGGILGQSSLPPGTRPDQRRRRQTICNYLDGVAARNNLPIAAPKDTN